MRTIRLLWLIVIILLLFQGYNSYWKLPDRMATHFNLSGMPNGWSDKDNFFMLWYLMLIGINLMFYVPSLFMHKIPPSLVNLPNKQYWFETEERKKIAMTKIRNLLFITMLIVNIYFGLIFETITRGNTPSKHQINPVWLFAPMGTMLAITIIYLLFAFKKPKSQN